MYLAGEFNDWKPAGLKMEGPDGIGKFQVKKTLPRAITSTST